MKLDKMTEGYLFEAGIEIREDDHCVPFVSGPGAGVLSGCMVVGVRSKRSRAELELGIHVEVRELEILALDSVTGAGLDVKIDVDRGAWNRREFPRSVVALEG